jgi:alpha-glucosidase
MKIQILCLTASLILLLSSCNRESKDISLSSPDYKSQLIFSLKNGVPYYTLIKNSKPVLNASRLGYKLNNSISLDSNYIMISKDFKNFNEKWEQPWGEVKTIQNNYCELKVSLQQKSAEKRKMNIIFRLYNDGLGFRYEFPEQENLKDFQITEEETQFNLPQNDTAWWIPAYKKERYEYLFRKSKVSEIDTVHTPFTIKTNNGWFLSLHEANITDFPSTTLYCKDTSTIVCDLVPWKNGIKAYITTPFLTPWRTVQIAESAGELVTNYLILNLNEPSKIKDTGWIKPGKYIGIWWGMHIGKYTWASGPKHGATTKNTMQYIDFASKYHFSGVLVEGWNTGWDGDWIANGSIFNFTEPYPDYDLKKLAEYARSKNVNLIGHNETSAHIENYERQIDSAYSLYASLGIHYLKTGYVGGKLFNGEWHHGQYGVRHYQKTVELAAKNHIMLDIHEPIKDSGIRRTWPNLMTREGARGMEWNAWGPDGGNPPNHEPTLVFTRLLAGPMDFTPGIFDLLLPSKPDNRVNTTLAKQLALYVVIYSPLQMAADLPENYEGKPEFQFILDVPCDWETTKVINGEIGEFVTTVRKDRNSDSWYLGSITNEQPRQFKIALDFLDSKKEYVAKIYADGKDADWKNNPYPVNISEKTVVHSDSLLISLAPGGGVAIQFKLK